MEDKDQSYRIYNYVPNEFKTRFIRSNDAWFYLKALKKISIDTTIKDFVYQIDNAIITDTKEWIMDTPFGKGISMEYLSTGCKTAINSYLFSDYLINFNESGGNVLKAVLTSNIGTNMYLKLPQYVEDDFEFSLATFLCLDTSPNLESSVKKYSELYDLMHSNYQRR